MQKDVTGQERKPSSISTQSNDSHKDNKLKEKAGAGNWSCNAGDSGIVQREGASLRPSTQDQNRLSTFIDDIVPKKDSGIVQRDGASIRPSTQDQNRSSNVKDDIVPKKEPCPMAEIGIIQRDTAGIRPSTQDERWSSNVKNDILPKKEPCPIAQNCDFDFKVLPPTGLYILLVINLP